MRVNDDVQKSEEFNNPTARLCPSTENGVLRPETTETFCAELMYGQLDDSVTVCHPQHITTTICYDQGFS